MKETKETIDEWLQHPITEIFRKKITETLISAQTDIRYTPLKNNQEERTADAVAMFNAYKQGQVDSLLEVEVVIDEMRGEAEPEELNGHE